MSSSIEAETLPRSKSAPAQTSDGRPTLSLGNQDVNMPANLQQLTTPAPSTKSVDRIRTFAIWSAFNLLLIPFGILCCYFSHKVSQLKMQNRYEGAKKWSKRTFTLNIITTLIMIGIVIAVPMLHYDYVQQNTVDIAVNQTRTTGAYIPWQPGR